MNMTGKKAISMLLSSTMILSLLASCSSSEGTPSTSTPTGSGSTSTTTTTPVGNVLDISYDAPVIGSEGGVSSSHPEATQIGIDILKNGGNAIDAAVAVAFAVGLMEPHNSGIGGAGLMTIYLAEEDRYTTIEYLETTPAELEPGVYNSTDDKYTAKNVAIPSQVHGLLTTLEKYGTMSREEVLAPVIAAARNGYTVNGNLASALGDAYDRIVENETALSIFTDGIFAYQIGDTIVNEPMADVLQAISDGGIEEFYTGETAQTIVDGLRAGGSMITMQDMADYYSVEREPISTNYHGYDVVTVSAPSNGGNQLLETLNILENYDLVEMGHNSIDYTLTMIEAMRISWVDAYTCLGDPSFFDLPIEKMVSKEYALERSEFMPVDGVPQYIDERFPEGDLVSTPVGEAAADSLHTTHISVIDTFGNIVSSTNTLGLAWGSSTMVEGTGFYMNSHISNMNHTDPTSPDYVMPGKRVRSTMSPTIVVKDGEPVMAIGSPGSLAIPTAIATVLNNVLLFDMDIQEAINAPRAIIITRTSPYSKTAIEADAFDPEVIEYLESVGYTIDNKGTSDSTTGGIAAIVIKDGELQAGADPRRNYSAMAY